VLAASQIARAIRDHKAKVMVFVPHYAMSGGTLIALAADQIVMSSHAVLGPVDPQLGHRPAASLIKVVDHKPIAEVDDETLILADVGRKAIEQVKKTARELLDRQLPPEQARRWPRSCRPAPGPTTTRSCLGRRRRSASRSVPRWLTMCCS
jgi:ClpP class serine protease